MTALHCYLLTARCGPSQGMPAMRMLDHFTSLLSLISLFVLGPSLGGAILRKFNPKETLLISGNRHHGGNCRLVAGLRVRLVVGDWLWLRPLQPDS
jgi:hypothetical protein